MIEDVLIPFIINKTLTDADTEYTQVLPDNCKHFTWQTRGGESFRYAWITGKVAGADGASSPVEPYMTCLTNGNLSAPTKIVVHPSYMTLYLATENAGTVVEILCYCSRLKDPYTGQQN